MSAVSAGGAILKAVSFVSGLLGISNFLRNEIASSDSKDPGDSVVRVAVALNSMGSRGLQEADGMSPSILAFNEDRQHIGDTAWWENRKIVSGSYKDIIVHQWRGRGQQATWLQVCATNDGLCIPYITQTWSDGTERGWLGDIGHLCNQSWYHSNIIVGDEGHKPKCTWIDKDHSNGIENSALQLHMEDFVQTSETNRTLKEPSYYCHLPAMLFKHDHTYKIGKNTWRRMWIFVYNTAKGRMPWYYTVWNGPEKGQYEIFGFEQGIKKRTVGHGFKHIISSRHQTQSAKELCESDSSDGPDFVSLHEKIFCDMNSKEAHPICDDKEDSVDCFHLDHQKAVLAKRDAGYMGSNGTMTAWRKYSHIEVWD